MNEEHLQNLLREALAEHAAPAAVEARARRLMPGPLASSIQALLQQARMLMAEIRLDSRRQPALAGFRGGGQPFQMLAAAAGHEVFLQVTSPPELQPQLRVRGQIDSKKGTDLDCEIAASSEADGHVFAGRAREDGTFELLLPPGRYELAIGLDPPFLVPGLDLA